MTHWLVCSHNYARSPIWDKIITSDATFCREPGPAAVDVIHGAYYMLSRHAVEMAAAVYPLDEGIVGLQSQYAEDLAVALALRNRCISPVNVTLPGTGSWDGRSALHRSSAKSSRLTALFVGGNSTCDDLLDAALSSPASRTGPQLPCTPCHADEATWCCAAVESFALQT